MSELYGRTKWISRSENDTLQAGREFAAILQPGSIVCLHGDLGAGKTHFTKGLASYFDIPVNEVNSPTFTLIHEYTSGRLPVYHFDAYRLNSPEEALDIGITEYLYGDGICVIEWPEKLGRLIPGDAIRLYLVKTGPDSREITIGTPA
jgi:tRNA threonylcarbamoyladenosine biosynthesis protein TsaE